MSNNWANSHVTTVNLKDDDTMEIIVQFNGFGSGELVEISGYVTQTEGAYSSFYRQCPVPPDASQPLGTVEVPVTIAKMDNLQDQDAMIVVTKVAKVWPTVLSSDLASGVTPEMLPAGVLARWTAEPAPKGANW